MLLLSKPDELILKKQKKKLSRKKVKNKKISEIFKLNKSQFELDFIDINIEQDTPLFIDSAYLRSKNDPWAKDSVLLINSFFSTVLSLISNEEVDKARKIFLNFSEPKETCLGLSSNSVDGSGPGPEKMGKIFNNLLESKAAVSGLFQDLEDSVIFVDKFGRDNLSDMITNIIKLQLIEYTQGQCKLLGIPLQKNVTTGQYWDQDKEEWSESYSEMLIIEGKKIVLVPKSIVVWESLYSKDRYYNHFALEFLQAQNLKAKTLLVDTRVKSKEKFVTKASIRKNESIQYLVKGFNICSLSPDKASLAKFSNVFPDEYRKF